jgi:hypothetical protein
MHCVIDWMLFFMSKFRDVMLTSDTEGTIEIALLSQTSLRTDTSV